MLRGRVSLACALMVTLGTFAHEPLQADPGPGEKPWLFFDLGNTLVSTEVDPATRDMKRVWWTRYHADDDSVTDSHTYLTALLAKGYKIGLISNIPQSWGDADLSRARQWLSEPDPMTRQGLFDALIEAKIQVMGEFFEGKGPGDPVGRERRWSDPDFPALEWSIFPKTARFVPFFDENRKPDKAPYTNNSQLLLFQQALEIAQRSGLPAFYQGENPHEIHGAEAVGLIGHLVPYVDGIPVQAKGFFLTEEAIEARINRR